MISERPNLFFRAALLLSALFVITILALIAALLGDPAAPATKFLDQRGGTLIAIEVGGIIITGLLAMFVDRRRTLKQSDDRQHEATVLESNEPEFPED